MSQSVNALGWACGNCTNDDHPIQAQCSEVVSGRCWLYREEILNRNDLRMSGKGHQLERLPFSKTENINQNKDDRLKSL
jgi:hypothetical protein